MEQDRKSQVVELDIKEMSKNGTPLAFFWMLLGNAISCLSYFESNIYGTCVCWGLATLGSGEIKDTIEQPAERCPSISGLPDILRIWGA